MRRGIIFYNVSRVLACSRLMLNDALDFNVRISEDEMRQLGKLDNNIPLPDGGYFGSLTVFHQLHCVVSCGNYR